MALTVQHWDLTNPSVNISAFKNIVTAHRDILVRDVNADHGLAFLRLPLACNEPPRDISSSEVTPGRSPAGEASRLHQLAALAQQLLRELLRHLHSRRRLDIQVSRVLRQVSPLALYLHEDRYTTLVEHWLRL